MKDSEFIELLNLYLDHEISPAKAAELEAEVTRDPARRALYRQYCQMQKACSVLADKFEGAAPAPALQPAEEFFFRPARRSATVGIWATGFLAAACAVLAIVTRTHPAAAPAGPAVAQSVPAAAPAPARNDFHPVFVARTLAPNAPAANALFPASSADASGQFAWMQQVQLAPIARPAAAPYLFAKPALDAPMEAGRAGLQSPTEKAAFQFQR